MVQRDAHVIGYYQQDPWKGIVGLKKIYSIVRAARLLVAADKK